MKKRSETFWRKHFHQWQQSGLSRKQYCEQYKIKLGAFKYWRSKFLSKKETTLLPVIIEDKKKREFPEQSGISIDMGSTFKLHIQKDFDQETLKQILLVCGRL